MYYLIKPWPLPLADGVEWNGATSTSAKVQKNIFRCKSGGNSELVGSCPELRQEKLTNPTPPRAHFLTLFKLNYIDELAKHEEI
jgi:hypothetical protein